MTLRRDTQGACGPVLRLVAGAVAVAAFPAARAEGYEELGDLDLKAYTSRTHATVLYVDIVDAANEYMVYTSTLGDSADDEPSGNQVVVMGPYGAAVGTYRSGERILPLVGEGTYTFYLQGDEDAEEKDYWDISVYDDDTGERVEGGRLWSYQWGFRTCFKESCAFDGSFYGLVPMGSEEITGVVELRAEGLAGGSWEAGASTIGLDPPFSGRSYPIRTSVDFEAELPLYLNPPQHATYADVNPVVTRVSLLSETGEACGVVVPDVVYGFFEFWSNVEGTYHVLCDTNEDGMYDLSGSTDVAITGLAETGWNDVAWDGLDAEGYEVPEGDYTCQIYVTVGEFHAVMRDVETVYPGLRLFQVQKDGSREGLDMYWDDTLLHGASVEEMPDGAFPLDSSGPLGVSAGDDADAFDPDPASPGYNARAWGSFTPGGGSKGDRAWLDTYSFLAIGESRDAVGLSIGSASLDTDEDCWPDAVELCLLGTDPEDWDSDDDGLSDCEEGAESLPE